MRINMDREVDGRWIAEIPDVPGAIEYGDTPEEAIAAAKEIARVTRELLEEDG